MILREKIEKAIKNTHMNILIMMAKQLKRRDNMEKELKELLEKEQDTVNYIKNSIASGLGGRVTKLAKKMIDIIEKEG